MKNHLFLFTKHQREHSIYHTELVEKSKKNPFQTNLKGIL